jgi:XPA protein C-terminus
MELTEEQREQIRQNRVRALERQKQRKSYESASPSSDNNGTNAKRPHVELDDELKLNKLTDKRRNTDETEEQETEQWKSGKDKSDPSDNAIYDDEIEAFEEGASDYITKQEAMKVYCLPQGTLDVCAFVEKPNPRNSTWQAMKLYHRNEIRRRAHLRYGGINGLEAEREKRNQLRLVKDIEKSKDVFK